MFSYKPSNSFEHFLFVLANSIHFGGLCNSVLHCAVSISPECGCVQFEKFPLDFQFQHKVDCAGVVQKSGVQIGRVLLVIFALITVLKQPLSSIHILSTFVRHLSWNSTGSGNLFTSFYSAVSKRQKISTTGMSWVPGSPWFKITLIPISFFDVIFYRYCAHNVKISRS